MTGRAAAIVCVSSQDWHVDLPTNRQQIARRLAREGRSVLFVESGGFVGSQLARLVRGPRRRSLARRLFATEAVEPGVVVQKAVNLLPWGRKYRLANRVNAALTARRLRRGAGRRLGERYVLWLYDPSEADLIGACGEAFAVYDCVDDYAEQALGPRRRALIAAGDHRAAAGSRIVFATSRTMAERHARLNERTHLVRNVGDFEHFAPAQERSHAAPDAVDVPRPVLGFAGNLLPAKVDFQLLEALARGRPDWSLLLVGPVARDAAADLERLTGLPNVRWVGPRAYGELPGYLAAFDVGIIPYVSNAYTASCFPLKVFEYLAAGKPVVASGLPELADLTPHVVLADGPSAFAAAAERALRSGEEGRGARVALAAANTWETRARRLLELVDAELAG